MKKLMPVLALCCLGMFSCEQEDETIVPQTASETQDDLQKDLPHYDESNSTAIAWDDFPAELKNATMIESHEKEAAPHARSMYSYYSFSVGPWGGNGGSAFYIYPPSGSKIYAIAMRAGSLVDRFTVWYKRSDGTIYMGGDRGGSGGAYYLHFFSSDEYIKSVYGRSGALIDRLGFYTNKKSFAYGGWGGSPFWVSVPTGHQVLGFYGRSGSLLDKIGFYIYTI